MSRVLLLTTDVLRYTLYFSFEIQKTYYVLVKFQLDS